MKIRTILLSLLLAISVAAMSQVTTQPEFITKSHTGAVRVIYDPSGSSMADAAQCYAHTGVVTTKSNGGWSHTKSSWRAANTPQLTREGDVWVLDIDALYTFYNVNPENETILKLAFVFHDGPNGSLEGKTPAGTDIFYDLCDDNLQVKIFSPDNSVRKVDGSVETIHVASSAEATITLYVNGTNVSQVVGTSLDHEITWSSAWGDYEIRATAETAEEYVTDTKEYLVAGTPGPTPRPYGTREGINYYTDGTGATLVMYCRDKNGVSADNVYLVGDFNSWRVSNAWQMIPDTEEGYFWVTIDGLTPGQEYAYQYDVQIGNTTLRVSDAYSPKILDPYDDKYIKDIYPNLQDYPAEGSGLVGVLQPGKEPFPWSEATLNFTPVDENNLVIYELWLYDFSKQRTIAEATRRLDYLAELGVNAIELMPVQEFDGNISWGYNPNHFFAPDKAYGTEEDYKTFIDECHKRGIAVLLDVVFNHASAQNPWCRLYWDGSKPKANNPWFNVEAPHPFSVHQDFNHASPYTQNMVKRCLQYWQEEYKVDGYRLDLTKGLTNRRCNESTASNYDADRISYLKMYYDAAKEVNDDVIFVIEHFCDSREENELSAYGLRPWSNYNGAFGQLAMGWLKDGDNITGMNKKGWVSFGESHDEERNYYKAQQWGNGTLQASETDRVNRVPLTVTFGMLQPGAKMIWMYGELGYDISINQNGRTGTKPLPENKGWFSNIYRSAAYVQCAQAIRLRTELLPEMFTQGTLSAKVGGGVAARMLKYTLGNDALTVVGNFNVNGGTQYTGVAEAKPFTKPGVWIEYFTNTPVSVSSTEQTINLNPGELRIYVFSNTDSDITRRLHAPNITNPQQTINGGGTGLWNAGTDELGVLYPTLAESMVTLEATAAISRIDIYNLAGQCVYSTKPAFATNTHNINVDALGSGMYLLVATAGTTQQAFKFIKR